MAVTQVNWYMGAGYCNWLSEQEGLEPCYVIQGDNIRLRKQYLSLTGYRFPTEAEMEYATRSETTTSRFFGESDELQRHYASCQYTPTNENQLVGVFKPNDFGFFDMQGCVSTWCQDRYLDFPITGGIVDDDEDTEVVVNPKVFRATRGGAFFQDTASVRSALRIAVTPDAASSNFGFRLARTLPTGAVTAP